MCDDRTENVKGAGIVSYRGCVETTCSYYVTTRRQRMDVGPGVGEAELARAVHGVSLAWIRQRCTIAVVCSYLSASTW